MVDNLSSGVAPHVITRQKMLDSWQFEIQSRSAHFAEKGSYGIVENLTFMFSLHTLASTEIPWSQIPVNQPVAIHPFYAY
jgi:hypothetical protein